MAYNELALEELHFKKYCICKNFQFELFITVSAIAIDG